MSGLRFERRWSYLWLAAIYGSHYAVLVYLAIGRRRLFVPLLAVMGYWLLAIAFNRHTARVRSSGVMTGLRPFPAGDGQNIPRAEIALCYARNIVITSDEGYEVANFFAAGVESRSGMQIDLHLRYETEEEALGTARVISGVLGGEPIPVRVVPFVDSCPGRMRSILLWTMIAIAALLAGWIWDLAKGTGRPW